MRDYYPKLFPGVYYHVYNRGNNKQHIFFKSKNYGYFLTKYKYYLSPWLDTYAYCLLPNHFHLLVRVKRKEHFLLSPIFLSGSEMAGRPDFPSFENLESLSPAEEIPLSVEAEILCQHEVSEFISEQFRCFFMSYSKAINKQEGRTGSLFQKNFKRLLVNGESHFGNLVHYIHANAQLHQLCDDFREYPYSSYPAYLSKKLSNLKRDEVISWFGSEREFVASHARKVNLNEVEELTIEEE